MHVMDVGHASHALDNDGLQVRNIEPFWLARGVRRNNDALVDHRRAVPGEAFGEPGTADSPADLVSQSGSALTE